MKLFEKPENCCGCGACKNICPKNAITMKSKEPRCPKALRNSQPMHATSLMMRMTNNFNFLSSLCHYNKRTEMQPNTLKPFGKEKTMNILKNIRNGALALSTASVAMVPTAFARSDIGDGVVKAILDVVYSMAFYIGIILLAWAVVMLVLALKNEDADSKSRAIMLIAVSIALIGVGTLLAPILKAAGF